MRFAIRPAVLELTAAPEAPTSRSDVAARVALVGAAVGTAAAILVGRFGAPLSAVADQAELGAVEGAVLAGVAVLPVAISVGCVGVLPFAAAGRVAPASARGAGFAGAAAGPAAVVWVAHFWVPLFERIRGWEWVRVSGLVVLAATGFSLPAARTFAHSAVSLGAAALAVPGAGHWECSPAFQMTSCRCLPAAFRCFFRPVSCCGWTPRCP